MNEPEEGHSIWVRADVEDGVYRLLVDYNPDCSATFDRDSSIAYAMALYDAAARAAHDAAVVAQLTKKIGMTAEDAAQILAKIRSEREPLDQAALGLLVVEPLVSVFTGQPFLKCSLTSDPSFMWQWSPKDADQHASHIMQCYPVCTLDAAYRSLLVDQMDIEPDRAANVVDDLINFRQDD